MSNFISKLSGETSSSISARTTPAMHVVLRMGVGLLFIQHGVQKLFGVLGGVDGAGATVPLFSLFGVAGVLETFGGLTIVLGLFTRPAALLLSVQMVIAYFMVHAPQGGFPIQNGGELAVFYALAFAFLATTGAGGWSIDKLLVGEKATDDGPQPAAIKGHRTEITDRGSATHDRGRKAEDRRSVPIER